MSEILIRTADKKDIPYLDKLLFEVQKVHSDARPDLFKSGGKKYTDEEIISILKNKHTPVFVAERGGEILGYAFCISKQITDSNTLTDIKTLYIDDLCVEKASRGQHIGKLLYDFVVDYAGRNGYYNVTLNVWADNKNAVEFYEHIGLKIQKIGMEKIL